MAIKRTRDAYEQVAGAYDTVTAEFNNSVVYPKIIDAAERFLGPVRGTRILDVGCGSGRLMELLEARGAECVGVDIARAFVETAKSRGRKVVRASMHDLPFGDSEFDGIVSNFAINYLPLAGQSRTLEEAYRVLKSGGALIFSSMHPYLMRQGGNYFEPMRQKEIQQLGQKFFLHLLDWQEIGNVVISSGFCLREFIDAEVPENLEEVAAKIDNDAAAQFVRAFRHQPYAMFVVATK